MTSISDDFKYLKGTDERKLSRQAWVDELNRKVGEYFGSHIYLRMREGYVSDLIDLRMTLTEREHAFVMAKLRQAALDYEKIIKHGWDESVLVGLNYPRTFKIENGNGHEKRQCLIQIFV